ncbi:MAG: hypothetical protein JWO67_2694 [Streptosporangiaceae bacterium]|nr:hypothetical protein [Streptosporangiaceae bacterium]
MSGLPVPSVPVFYAGQAPTAQLNIMSNAFSFLLAKVAFRARRAATGTVTKNAHTLVPWDTIDEDPYTGWAAGTPTIYTVQAPGWYLCTGTISLAGTGAAGTVLIPAFAINGGSQTGQGSSGWEGPEIFIPTGATDPKCASGGWEGYCNAGDQITLDCFLSSEPAANLTWQTTAGAQSRIEILWTGV